MTENMTASAAMKRDEERAKDTLNRRLRWFFEKHAPEDKRNAAEFHADLMIVVQEIHGDASRTTHQLLMAALAAAPVSSIIKRD